MTKKAFFYIDDVIWVFRDLTRQRPASMFDNPFLKLMKQGHDLYGMNVQLNVFYRTDFFYGNDEFTLADMTDAYKAEWEEASDWLKLGFHAKQEFPDYPWVNASYEDVRDVLEDVKREVLRFAGEKTFARTVVPHWNPISKAGIRALKDGGIKLTSMTYGKAEEYNGDPSSLPYGHAGRLLQNRQPETKVYLRNTKDTAAARSLCAYNHFDEEEAARTYLNLKTLEDPETGMHFSRLACGLCLNLNTLGEVEETITSFVGHEYVGYGTHEQYFYEDYYNYQPEYPAKVLKAAEIMHNNGYTYLFPEDLVSAE